MLMLSRPNSMRCLIFALIAASFSLLTMPVDARPIMVLDRNEKLCLLAHTLLGSTLKIKYHCLEDHISRSERDQYYIDVRYTPRADREYDERPILSHQDILTPEGVIEVPIDYKGDVNICVFSNSKNHAIGLDVTFEHRLPDAEKSSPQNNKLDMSRTEMSLNMLKKQIESKLTTLKDLLEYADEFEHEESLIYYKYDATLKTLTWAPTIRLFILMIVGVTQAKYIIKYLKSQHII
mmetsp:Transcript_8108/g.7649  ORF Transcript_8108/g.7649 Transcript_8108/m.7649 type:complete len:236 (-) Transcript_8108:157-864(-)